MKLATIIVPSGYKSAKEFAADCGVELAETVAAVADHPIYPGDLVFVTRSHVRRATPQELSDNNHQLAPIVEAALTEANSITYLVQANT